MIKTGPSVVPVLREREKKRSTSPLPGIKVELVPGKGDIELCPLSLALYVGQFLCPVLKLNYNDLVKYCYYSVKLHVIIISFFLFICQGEFPLTQM